MISAAESDQAQVVAALSYVGVVVERIRDMNWASFNDERAVPILTEWLSRPINLDVKLGILQVLGHRWVGPAPVPELIRQFEILGRKRHRSRLEDQVMFSIGDVLFHLATLEHFDDLIRIASRGEYGTGRGRIVEALARFSKRREETVHLLEDLLESDELLWFVLRAARRVRAVELLDKVEHLPERVHLEGRVLALWRATVEALS